MHTDINALKQELRATLKEEVHRKNVDTAKKTACKQLMDYANFEQMVLGADL
jgi:nicotinamide riboside kinase